MAVSFTSVAPSASGQTASNPTSMTWTHAVSGSDPLLLVGVAVGQNSGSDASKTISSVTYAGTAMTSLGVRHTNNQTAGYVQAFALAAPASGTNSIVVTFASAPSTAEAGSLLFNGAGGVGTPVLTSGAVATATATVPTTSADSVLAFFVANGNDIGAAPTSPATLRWRANYGYSSAGGCGAAATLPGTGSAVVCAWPVSSDWYAEIAVEVQPTAGPAPVQSVSGTSTVGLASSGSLSVPSAAVQSLSGGSSVGVGSAGTLDVPLVVVQTLSGGSQVSIASSGTLLVPTAAVAELSGSSTLGLVSEGVLDAPAASVPALTGGSTLGIASDGHLAALRRSFSSALALAAVPMPFTVQPAVVASSVAAVRVNAEVTVTQAPKPTAAAVPVNYTVQIQPVSFTTTASQDAYSAPDRRLSMASTATLTVIERNDEQINLVFARNGAPIDLTDLGIEFVLKPSASVADDADEATTLTLAAGDISIVDAAQGKALLHIAAQYLPSGMTQAFWKCDLLDGTERHTTGYGAVTVINV